MDAACVFHFDLAYFDFCRKLFIFCSNPIRLEKKEKKKKRVSGNRPGGLKLPKSEADSRLLRFCFNAEDCRFRTLGAPRVNCVNQINRQNRGLSFETREIARD